MHTAKGILDPTGALALEVIRRPRTAVPAKELSLAEILRYGMARPEQHEEVRQWKQRNLRHLMRGLARVMLSRVSKLPTFYGSLSVVVIGADGRWLDLGLVSMRVVTNAGVNFIVDAFQNLVELEIMKYHGIGTGSAAESASDTALGTELTTQYNPDNTRATGSLTEGASANVFRTVGTNSVDAPVGIQEHGILSQAATGGGTLLDRSVFSVVNLGNGDSLQSTYDLTVSAGG